MRRFVVFVGFLCLATQHPGSALAHNFTGSPSQTIRPLPLPEQERQALEQVPEPSRAPLRGVLDTLKVWPTGHTLEVCFTGGSEPLRQFFVETAKLWSEIANLTFNFGAGPHYRDCQPFGLTDMRVAFAADGNWSYVGTDSRLEELKGKPTLNIGAAAGKEFTALRHDRLRGTILHELGHALGLEHEHQSPESGCDAEFDWPAIYQGLGWSKAEVDNNMRTLVTTPRRRVTTYDPKSIMHYALPAWMFKAREQSRCRVAENLILSEGDKAIISAAYPGSKPVQQRYIAGRGEQIEALLGQSGITQEQAKAIAELAKAIVGQSNPDMKFAIRIDNIRKEENKQEGLNQNISGSCNIGVQGTQGNSNVTISGGQCNNK